MLPQPTTVPVAKNTQPTKEHEIHEITRLLDGDDSAFVHALKLQLIQRAHARMLLGQTGTSH